MGNRKMNKVRDLQLLICGYLQPARKSGKKKLPTTSYGKKEKVLAKYGELDNRGL